MRFRAYQYLSIYIHERGLLLLLLLELLLLLLLLMLELLLLLLGEDRHLLLYLGEVDRLMAGRGDRLGRVRRCVRVIRGNLGAAVSVSVVRLVGSGVDVIRKRWVVSRDVCVSGRCVVSCSVCFGVVAGVLISVSLCAASRVERRRDCIGDAFEEAGCGRRHC